MSTININVSKVDMGLDQVDNTSDVNKPISTATQTALDNKVDKVTGKGLSTEDYTTSEKSDVAFLSNVTQDVQQQINNKVNQNTLITPATKTKIEYDAKGLILSGADATTADIADSTNKRYVTNAQLTVIGNTSGTNTGDQDLSGLQPTITATNDATFVNSLSGITTPVDADKISIVDTSLSLSKKMTWANVKATLKIYFDTLYPSFAARTQTITSASTVTATSTNDLVIVTALAVGMEISNPSGTWTEGQCLQYRIKDNGTSRAITFGTNVRNFTTFTATTASKWTYLGMMYNATDSKWDITGFSTQS